MLQKPDVHVEEPVSDGYIQFETGILSFEKVSAVFNTLPLDITFVNKAGIAGCFLKGKIEYLKGQRLL